MNNTLEDALRGSAADLFLDRPVGDVMARGDRLRRRRARRFAAGGVAAAAVVASALSLTLPSSTTPLVPAANAAWGPALVNLPADELDQAGRVCRSMVSDLDWQLPRDAQPLAADARDGVAMLFYRIGDRTADCTLTTGAGFGPASSSTGTWHELPAGTHVELISLTVASATLDGPVHQTAGAVRVSDAVDRVEIEVAGQVKEATVANGLAMFWVPDGISQAELDALTITAFDADGGVLVSDQLLALPRPKAPNDDQDR